jgi:hypothetical protein
MPKLATQQRAILALLKNKPVDDSNDAWVQQVSQSLELAMLREIARWWRQYQVSAQCMFTARMLKRSGTFEETVNGYFEQNATSPFIEEMARDFLRTVSAGHGGLLASIAATELGLLNAKDGKRTEVEWDRNPDLVFAALDQGTDLPGADDEFSYRLSIADKLACIRERLLQ